MRVLYLIRVIFVSFEALALVTGIYLATNHGDMLRAVAKSMSINEDLVKWLMLLPVAVAAWIINETRLLLQEDKETVRILTKWPYYWRLKVHTWVGLGYAVTFSCMSIIPWVAKEGINTGYGLLLFATSLVGQFCVATSVYAARIRTNELISDAKAP